MTCADGSACNARLATDGTCPGTCVVIASGLHCRGDVVAGVCLGGGLTPYPTRIDLPPLVLELGAVPSEAHPGESHTFTVSVRNEADHDATATLRAQAAEDWTLLSPAETALQLAAGEVRSVDVVARAERSNGAVNTRWTALLVSLDDGATRPRPLVIEVPIGYAAADDTMSCGERHFPASRVGDDRAYAEARCCGGVFFPAASCCESADCDRGGTCADGVCVERVAAIDRGTAPLVGPQRVLVVMLDDSAPSETSAPTCTDHVGEWGDAMEVAAVEAWYARTEQARAGRSTTTFQWTVLGGLRSADVMPQDGGPAAYGEATERYLVAAGCTPPWAETFDRTIVVSPQVAIGQYAGVAYARDRVAMRFWAPALAAHELMHTYGADDRYLSTAGAYQHDGALMGFFEGNLEAERDDVAWAEAGLADVDHDGELDILAFSRAPERLVVDRLEVDASLDRGYLGLRVRIAAEEGARRLRVAPHAVVLELPDYGVEVSFDGLRDRLASSVPEDDDLFFRTFSVPRDLPRETLEAIAAEGTVRVRVRASHFHTTEAFARVERTLDASHDVAVAVTSLPGNPGPIPGGLRAEAQSSCLWTPPR